MQEFDSSLAEYYVQPLEKKKALEVLTERIAEGEDPEVITQIKEKYYLKKITSGLCPMSALIYTRIMLETPLPKPAKEPQRCIRCGNIIGKQCVYCPDCKDTIKHNGKMENDSTETTFPWARRKGSYLWDKDLY